MKSFGFRCSKKKKNHTLFPPFNIQRFSIVSSFSFFFLFCIFSVYDNLVVVQVKRAVVAPRTTRKIHHLRLIKTEMTTIKVSRHELAAAALRRETLKMKKIRRVPTTATITAIIVMKFSI